MQSPLLPRGPAQHGAHTRTVPVDLDAQAACSQPRRARQLLDTLLRTARSDEARDKQGLDSPSTAGQRLRTEPVEPRASADTRSSSPHAPARRVGDRGACRVAGSSTARAQVSAVTQRGGESNYLDSHTIPST